MHQDFKLHVKCAPEHISDYTGRIKVHVQLSEYTHAVSGESAVRRRMMHVALCIDSAKPILDTQRLHHA